MRLISGKYKGRRVSLPKGVAARPTPDRVREALFSMLHERITDSNMLDLFAGSGAFGMEGLSRGARHVVFCDKDRRCIHSIAGHLESFGVKVEQYMLCTEDYERSLMRLKKQGEQFDLVYLDPPYQSDYYVPAIELLQGMVTKEGMILCESERKRKLPDVIGGFRKLDVRAYGSTAVSIYMYER